MPRASWPAARRSRALLGMCAMVVSSRGFCHVGHLGFLRKRLTSSGVIRSGTVYPSRSYSAMHCSASLHVGEPGLLLLQRLDQFGNVTTRADRRAELLNFFF